MKKLVNVLATLALALSSLVAVATPPHASAITLIGGGTPANASAITLPSTTTWTTGGMNEMFRVSGNLYASVDGLGVNEATGTLQVEKPSADATVLGAFMTVAMKASGTQRPATVTLASQTVTFTHSTTFDTGPEQPFTNYLADVTEIVKPSIDAGAVGVQNINVNEGENSSFTDGTSLIVIFHDPNQAVGTVFLMFGISVPAGDSFGVSFDSLANDQLDGHWMSLGIGYSYQAANYTQASVVEIATSLNPGGTTLSDIAGGADDGDPRGDGLYPAGGTLITVGGVGDSTDLPASSVYPTTNTWNGDHQDDELYGLNSFLSAGDTSLTLTTRNASGDDNLFQALIYLDGIVATGASALVPPVNRTLTYHANIPTGATATASADFTGSPLTYSTTAESGSTVSLYEDVDINLSVPGYMFTGWNTEADGTGTPYDSLKNVGETLEITADEDFYAQWATISVTTSGDEFLVTIEGTQPESYQYFSVTPEGELGGPGFPISSPPVSVLVGETYTGEFPETTIECGVTYTFSYADVRNNTYGTITPISVEASIPCATAGGNSTPYTGPVLSSFSTRTLDPCIATAVTITGSNLLGATATIQDKAVTVLENTATKLVLAFPAGLAAAQGEDLIVTSSAGTLRFQNAFDISSDTCATALSKGRWTQLQSDGKTIKFYAKDPIGDGKIQFFVDGKELAWINAIDESDPKLSVASGNPYLVRSVELNPGKNRFEIKLDGERVWRATYVPKG